MRSEPRSRTPTDLRLACASGIVLAGAYAGVLARLARYAVANEFNTYILMIPPLAAFLYWARPAKRGRIEHRREGVAALVAVAATLIALSFHFAEPQTGRLDCQVLSLTALIAAWSLLFFGGQAFRASAFPIALLVFMAPLPAAAVSVIESILQHLSSQAAYLLFHLVGLPVLQTAGINFELPGITLYVAPACSGIQSSVALFVVSLAAGYLFIRSPWLRVVLTLAVFPLGILRNAIRIVTVGELCSHYGPQMIDSYIHRQGGWIFFLVFLVPFFALLLALAHFDRPPPTPHE